MTTHVEHRPDVKRFEVLTDTGVSAGFAAYEDAGANRAFVHTEVYSRYEGQGLGKVLITGALEQTREAGLGVLPFCPFVHRFVSKNPEYLELVPEWARERLGLPVSSS